MKADLHPGDVLMIPTLWLHDVEYLQGGHGVNAFYDAPQKDLRLCLWLKDHLHQMDADQLRMNLRESDTAWQGPDPGEDVGENGAE